MNRRIAALLKDRISAFTYVDRLASQSSERVAALASRILTQ